MARGLLILTGEQLSWTTALTLLARALPFETAVDLSLKIWAQLLLSQLSFEQNQLLSTLVGSFGLGRDHVATKD